MSEGSRINARVLVIDDEENVRESFVSALGAAPTPDPSLATAASILFDEAPAVESSVPGRLLFEVDAAANGKDAASLVEAAIRADRPYAACFCDMRMPGWDGIETIEAIRTHDRRLEVVFVTAYSDHSLDTIIERAGANVGYFVKPFLPEELRQLATKLVLDWNRARELELLMRTVTSLRGDAADIGLLVSHLLQQICMWLETDSAALIRLSKNGEPSFEIGTGALTDHDAAAPLLERAQEALRRDHLHRLEDGTTVLPLHDIGFAIALGGTARITPDREYLLRVFVEHAALAIQNSEMHQRLVAQERMAAVGQALSYVVHDLRNPIGIARMMAPFLLSGEPGPFGTTEVVLERLEKNLDRALNLVEDTLSFSRGRLDLQIEPVLLARHIKEDIDLLVETTAKREVELICNVPSDLEAWVDPERLWRAIGNLVNNAVDAVAGSEGARVEIGADRRDLGIELWVEDNGPGIPAELGEALFEPFATANKKGGTGFGLAIVRQIVESHDGTISLRREDRRTRFVLFFPDPTD